MAYTITKIFNLSANNPINGNNIIWESDNINPNLSKLTGMNFGWVRGTYGQVVGLLVYASRDYFAIRGELSKKQYNGTPKI